MSYLAVEVTLAEALANEQDGYLCVFTTGHMQFRLGKNLQEYEYYGDDYDKLLRLYPFEVDPLGTDVCGLCVRRWTSQQ